MLHSFDHLKTVFGLALQPGADGNVIATACKDGIIRLYDTRKEKNSSFIHSIQLILFSIKIVLKQNYFKINNFIPFCRCGDAVGQATWSVVFGQVFTCRENDDCCGCMVRRGGSL